MRTTLNVNDELLRLAREEAARTRTTLTALFEDALRQRLCRPATSNGSEPPFDLPISDVPPGQGGLWPGLDWYELQYLDAGIVDD